MSGPGEIGVTFTLSATPPDITMRWHLAAEDAREHARLLSTLASDTAWQQAFEGAPSLLSALANLAALSPCLQIDDFTFDQSSDDDSHSALPAATAVLTVATGTTEWLAAFPDDVDGSMHENAVALLSAVVNPIVDTVESMRALLDEVSPGIDWPDCDLRTRAASLATQLARHAGKSGRDTSGKAARNLQRAERKIESAFSELAKTTTTFGGELHLDTLSMNNQLSVYMQEIRELLNDDNGTDLNERTLDITALPVNWLSNCKDTFSTWVETRLWKPTGIREFIDAVLPYYSAVIEFLDICYHAAPSPAAESTERGYLGEVLRQMDSIQFAEHFTALYRARLDSIRQTFSARIRAITTGESLDLWYQYDEDRNLLLWAGPPSEKECFVDGWMFVHNGITARHPTPEKQVGRLARLRNRFRSNRPAQLYVKGPKQTREDFVSVVRDSGTPLEVCWEPSDATSRAEQSAAPSTSRAKKSAAPSFPWRQHKTFKIAWDNGLRGDINALAEFRTHLKKSQTTECLDFLLAVDAWQARPDRQGAERIFRDFIRPPTSSRRVAINIDHGAVQAVESAFRRPGRLNRVVFDPAIIAAISTLTDPYNKFRVGR